MRHPAHCNRLAQLTKQFSEDDDIASGLLKTNTEIVPAPIHHPMGGVVREAGKTCVIVDGPRIHA
jgi:hypothetical protein